MERRAGLGVGAGAALCVGAVLGPGALTLASVAAAAAGPASLLAWAALIALALPTALTLAALAARHPGAGGVADFAERAFGPTAGVAVGWWFTCAVLLGVPAAALIGGAYTATALGAGPGTARTAALAALAAAYAANGAGVRVSAKAQLLLVGALVALLGASLLLTAPQVRRGAFTPFLPHGWPSVGTAAGLLFFAFAGWEAVTHLSGEFTRPRHALPRAVLLAWTVVAVLQFGLAAVTVGALGERAGSTVTPLLSLLRERLGDGARPVVVVVALLFTFGAANAYLTSGTALGTELAQRSAFPRPLAAHPRRTLTTLTAGCATVVLAATSGLTGLAALLRATSACLAAVTLVGLLAAAVLLPARLPRAGALGSAAATAAVLLCCGRHLLLPAALAAAALLLRRPRRTGRPGPARPAGPRARTVATTGGPPRTAPGRRAAPPE
ncbi:APC family permease [Kitasatospora sp. NPDC001540]|uniref:APC family permease n=1 Tax=Kitasatospora sp. NPDC001540 TaxID=3364014 RepID=UPI0036BD54C7